MKESVVSKREIKWDKRERSLYRRALASKYRKNEKI